MDMISVGDRLKLACFAKAELSMRDSKHIRGERTTLFSGQMDVLERETFGGVTEEESCEYEA